MTTSSLMSPLWLELPNIPDEEGFAGSYAGVSHKVLLVAGGANFPEKPFWEGGAKMWHDTIYALSSPEGEWVVAGKLPYPYAYGASASIQEGLVCIGGCDKEGHRPDVFHVEYVAGELCLTEWAPLPVPLAYMTAVVLGDRLYVFGGCQAPGEQDASNALYSLDINAPLTGWVEEAPLPGRGRFLYEMGVYEERFFVVGGIGLKVNEEGKIVRELLTETWSYSVAEGWTALAAPLPRPCAAAPSPAPVDRDGNMYLVGGDDGSLAGFSPIAEHPGFPSQCLAFNNESGTWEELGEVLASRAVLPCCRWGKLWVMVNGEMRPGKRSNEVWAIPFA